MEDIVKRLRGWRGLHLAHGGELFESAADEIERLKWRLTVRENIIGRLVAENERLRLAIRRLADQDATLSVCDGAVTVTLDATLTVEERAAIEDAACACGNCNGFGGDPTRPAIYRGDKIAATLRALLARLPK